MSKLSQELIGRSTKKELAQWVVDLLEENQELRMALRVHCDDCGGTGMDPVCSDSPCDICGDPE